MGCFWWDGGVRVERNVNQSSMDITIKEEIGFNAEWHNVCVCVCSGNTVPGGSCNHGIPIATSPPRESPPHLCHPVVLPLRSPWGAFRRGFQRVPRSLDSVTRSDVTTWAMSHQVFIAGTACISGEGQQPPPTSDVRDTGQLGLLGRSLA